MRPIHDTIGTYPRRVKVVYPINYGYPALGNQPQDLECMLKHLFKRVIQSRIFRDSSFLFAGDGFRTLLSILSSIMVGRILGVDHYGIAIIAMTAVNTVVQFIDMRTEEGLIKFMGGALARNKPQEALTYFHVALGFDSLIMIATLIVAGLLSPFLVAQGESGVLIRQLIWIYVLAVPFMILEDTFETVLIIYKQFRLLTFKFILSSVVLFFCLVLLAAHGIQGLMWGYVIGAGFSFGLSVIFATALLLKNIDTLRGQNYAGAWRQFLPFAFHTSFMASLKAVAQNIDILLLGALRPPSEVSFYKVARNAANLLSMPVAPMATVIYPAINDAWAQNNMARVKHLIKQFMRYSAVISVSLTLLLMFTADILVLVTYGVAFFPTANLLRLIVVGIAIENIARWMRPAALAGGKPHLVTISGTAALIIRLAVTLPLIWFYGAMGAIIAYLVGVLVIVGLNIFYVLPKIGLWTPFRVHTVP
jgi:O-antigen/teichoic acid export membrane protein